MIFETSRDVLNLTIAGAVALFTIFLCWMMYYFIKTIRNVSKITTGVKDKMETIDKILGLVKDKLEKGSNHMALLSDSAIKLVGFLIDKKSASDKKSSRKKK